MKTPVKHFFPVGARVYVDGDADQQAIVSQVFPEGSTSLLYPHYVLRPVGGTHDEKFSVKLDRVGVDLKKRS
jgi:hypothetical protein